MFQPNEQEIAHAYKLVLLSNHAYDVPDRFITATKEFGFENDTGLIYYFFTEKVRAYLCRDSRDNIFVIFRGTETFKQWIRNICAWTIGIGRNKIKLHKGFWNAFNEIWPATIGYLYKSGKAEKVPYSLKDLLHALTATNATRVWFTGHSLGGALATIAAEEYVHQYQHKKENVYMYTFGCPNVGNKDLGDEFNIKFQCLTPQSRAFRYVMHDDLVTAANFVSLAKCGSKRLMLNDGTFHVDPNSQPDESYKINPGNHGIANYISKLEGKINPQSIIGTYF